MGPHHRMDDTRLTAVGMAMHGVEPIQHLLHGARQRLVGQVLVGEQRVAAIGWHVDAVEDGAHRRLGAQRGVGVPGLPEIRRIARRAPHHHHLRVGAPVLQQRMHEEVAEAASERLVSGRVELLVAEEHDAMRVQRVADLADHGLVEVTGDIDTEDLRAARARQGPHLDARIPHGPFQKPSYRRAGYTGRTPCAHGGRRPHCGRPTNFPFEDPWNRC